MSNIFIDLITPNSGKSHKRALATASGITLIVVTIADAFTKIEIDHYFIDALLWVTLGGMGASTLENFAPGKRNPMTTMETKTTIVEPAPEDITAKP